MVWMIRVGIAALATVNGGAMEVPMSKALGFTPMPPRIYLAAVDMRVGVDEQRFRGISRW